MKGCKIGHIKPCSVETAQEMIKTLEDFSKSLVVELKACELMSLICEDARKSIKSNDMEEKKTKKMTKAEAFEWLKGKKVNTKGRGKEVQTKLFECGFSWVNGQCRYYGFSDYLLFETDGKLCHCGEVGDGYWRLHHFEEISVDDILSIEIVDENCELEFNYDKAVELAKPLMHYLSETGHTEVISVCMEGISAIPMGTFLYKG